MELIRKLIREELKKVVETLSEDDLYRDSDYGTEISTDPKDEIIYNYEEGRTFAGDSLAMDIDNLSRYNLSEYLPKSPIEEQWSFEYETVYGTILIVDILRQIKNVKNKETGSLIEKSFWSLSFGQLYKGEKHPTLIAEIENIEGYENFINSVNSKLGSKLDPSKY